MMLQNDRTMYDVGNKQTQNIFSNRFHASNYIRLPKVYLRIIPIDIIYYVYDNSTDIDNKLIAYCDNKVKFETIEAAMLFKKAKLYYYIIKYSLKLTHYIFVRLNDNKNGLRIGVRRLSSRYC